MHIIDISIIIAYLLMMIVVGVWVTKKASKNSESYFLAGKSLPWWIIGVAHGSSGVDITGTMWFVMMFFIYGVKGIWLLWVWPLFSVIFRMMYLGTWVRRSNVLTGAEWMRTRFGYTRGAELAYLSVVVYSLFMFFTGMLFFKGVLVSMAGPTPNYAIQHVLSTRSPREAALENMVMAVVSLAPRFLLIAAIAVIGIVFFGPDLAQLVTAKGKNAKFEEILPQVLSRGYIPVGFKGVLIAALLASFMSTFVSTVNSGAAYVVNDICMRCLPS